MHTREYLDQTVSLLSNRDKEEKDKRKELANTYREEL